MTSNQVASPGVSGPSFTSRRVGMSAGMMWNRVMAGRACGDPPARETGPDGFAEGGESAMGSYESLITAARAIEVAVTEPRGRDGYSERYDEFLDFARRTTVSALTVLLDDERLWKRWSKARSAADREVLKDVLSSQLIAVLIDCGYRTPPPPPANELVFNAREAVDGASGSADIEVVRESIRKLRDRLKELDGTRNRRLLAPVLRRIRAAILVFTATVAMSFAPDVKDVAIDIAVEVVELVAKSARDASMGIEGRGWDISPPSL